MTERRIGVRGIAYQNGKLLSVLHRDRDGKPVDFWATPGGGLDPQESVTNGILREMIEETAITPTIGRLLFVQQFLAPTRSGDMREHLEFFFHIENPEKYALVDLTATTHGEAELAAIEWIDPKTSNILPAFLQTLDIDAAIRGDQPVYIWNELTAN
jgi:ADP-ribose pyrophosphatase YjhB (NUDIX family)